jgi:molybdate transport system ATP-binding protein
MSGIHARFNIIRPNFALHVDLPLPASGVSALFGASGSGKTSCLRAIAGLDRIAGGYLEVNGEVWQDESKKHFLPTHQRPLAYVFQEASLFEHLTIRQNIDYGFKRTPVVQRKISLEQAIDLLGIEHLLACRANTLSGGERQRVAIARALAVSPQLLLMDEPLAALDSKRKNDILPYLERLQHELAIPIIYVSHALDEVARLADYVVLLEQGRVAAQGATIDLMTRLDLSLAHGDSAEALINATVVDIDSEYHLACVEFSGGRLSLLNQQVTIGQTVKVRIQARDVSLTLDHQRDTSILNIIPVTVTDIADDSIGQVMVGLDANGTRLLARITRKSAMLLNLVPHQQLYAQIKGVAILK